MYNPITQANIDDIYVAKVIAQAITEVASKEYQRLCGGSRRSEVAEQLTDALKQLRGLRRGVMPIYNNWVSLCYLTWYQPHHINLAYTLLGDLPPSVRRSLSRIGGLEDFRWIDFGCGSLPMHISLYAALATGRFLPDSKPRMLSYGIDPSSDMLRLGKSVLAAIKGIDPRLAAGSENLRIYESPRHMAASHARKPTILSVMHTFYRENQRQVEHELRSLVGAADPELILVTSHPSSAELVDDTFLNFRNSYHDVRKRFDYTEPLRFNGELGAITYLRQDWRRLIQDERVDAVNEGLSAQRDYAGVNDVGLGDWDGESDSIRRFLHGSDLQYIDDTNLAIRFLNNPVKWSGRGSRSEAILP